MWFYKNKNKSNKKNKSPQTINTMLIQVDSEYCRLWRSKELVLNLSYNIFEKF
jgi:hypothetical protein